MTTNDVPPGDRVIWVGGRRSRSILFGRGHIGAESDGEWRERLAQEMTQACGEMANEGLRLGSIVPVQQSLPFWGGWTEGAWLHFARAE